jgi:ABC-2 type transport system permease protein
MTTRVNAMPESSLDPPAIVPAAMTATQTFLWSVRRELWENRAVYIAPLIAAGVFLFGFLVNMIKVRRHLQGSPLDPMQQHQLFLTRHELAAALVMGTAFIVGIFYTLDALYGERRDRSILFWKSLPISDLTVVLSKVTIPMVILPFLSFVLTIATQFVMLLLGSAILLGTGVNIPMLWRDFSFFHVTVDLLYHIVTVHGLWYAPIYGWLLMVSASAPRAPFLWAFLPPFVICGLERIAFNTTHCLNLLQERLTGPASGGSMSSASDPMDPMAHLIPHHFFSEPGLWIGLLIAAIFVAIAVQLRRRQGPI